jgi:formylglycine-generating enzyme required for sulfatase activity
VVCASASVVPFEARSLGKAGQEALRPGPASSVPFLLLLGSPNDTLLRARALSALGTYTLRGKSGKEAPPRSGTIEENSIDGLKYVWIPPGKFQMGCSPGDLECDADEKPLHEITIRKGFWMGQTEVTVRAYKSFASETRRDMPKPPTFNFNWAKEALPMVTVSWDDAKSYCHWAGGRLPTEAEWEYAARAGNTDPRYAALDEVGWYADNSGEQTLDSERLWENDRPGYYKTLLANRDRPHRVARKRANAFGLYDTLGNVWEWVNDWFDVYYYKQSPATDPAGPPTGSMRALRGGSWITARGYFRVSFRYGLDPSLRYEFLGIRCAR